eukprot:7380255-Prymnesium_polylepis.2
MSESSHTTKSKRGRSEPALLLRERVVHCNQLAPRRCSAAPHTSKRSRQRANSSWAATQVERLRWLRRAVARGARLSRVCTGHGQVLGFHSTLPSSHALADAKLPRTDRHRPRAWRAVAHPFLRNVCNVIVSPPPVDRGHNTELWIIVVAAQPATTPDLGPPEG